MHSFLYYYLILSVVLFSIGVIGVLTRRNALVVFMCIELMLNGANLALVAFSRFLGVVDGQVFVFFVMVVAASEVAVGLAILIAFFRIKGTADVDAANLLKG